MTKGEAIKIISDIINSLDDIEEIINEICLKSNDRDLKIYLDKKYKNLTNDELEIKYGIGTRQIQKICKKFNESSPQVRF